MVDGGKDSEYPAAKEIPVFKGMPVLATINRATYKNGTYGVVTKVCRNHIVIRTQDGRSVRIYVRKLHARKGKGIIRQLPVAPAYAMTIHKAQGQTFDRIVLNPRCFAPGQLYTALSRVRTIEGLTLTAKIRPKDLICSPAVRYEVPGVGRYEE